VMREKATGCGRNDVARTLDRVVHPKGPSPALFELARHQTNRDRRERGGAESLHESHG
jgi:hypothetical protein